MPPETRNSFPFLYLKIKKWLPCLQTLNLCSMHENRRKRREGAWQQSQSLLLGKAKTFPELPPPSPTEDSPTYDLLAWILSHGLPYLQGKLEKWTFHLSKAHATIPTKNWDMVNKKYESSRYWVSNWCSHKYLILISGGFLSLSLFKHLPECLAHTSHSTPYTYRLVVVYFMIAYKWLHNQ